jgi:hypothetical protein
MMFKKKISQKEFDEVHDDLWKLQDKVEEICRLLSIGFTADKDYPVARYLDLERSANSKIKKS